MRSSKEFLLLECESVGDVLQETLRHDYGTGGSQVFFEECVIRLEFIKQEIINTNEADHSALENNAGLLILLSELIARIERASIGEYSWPFVDALKKIGNAICSENTAKKDNAPPIMHVLSDGGLDKYAINVEDKKPSGGSRRVLTIIFPRSLKHFVLLHPVLGHELGHAIWRGSEHEATIQDIVYDILLKTNNTFGDSSLTAAWMYSPQAPTEIQQILAEYKSDLDVGESEFFLNIASWDAWVEELTCDLIGLLIFGPSFVAALCQLLHSLVSSGMGFSEAHPPVGCRINIMLAASEILNYDKLMLADGALQADVAEFWAGIKRQRKSDPWFDIFSVQELTQTLTAIQQLLGKNAPSRYDSPNPVQFQKLLNLLINQVPPLDFEIQDDGTPLFADVDFRHILYAGWVASKDSASTSFLNINRLCEHAIMQLKSVETFMASSS